MVSQINRTGMVGLVAFAGLVGLAPAALGQFYSVGRPPGEFGGYSQVNDLSADGRVAVGDISDFSIPFGFTWTREGGRYEFGRETGFPTSSGAAAISADGLVAAGTARNRGGAAQAFRWRGAGTYQSLGSVGGNRWVNSTVTDANGDGNVIVGTLTDSILGGFSEPFRWTEDGGMRSLGRVPGSIHCQAWGVSDDGDTVVGTSNAGNSVGWVWTSAAGMRILDSGSSTDFNTDAYGISHNGQYIVGTVGLGISGALWTEDGVINLGRSPSGYDFQASGVDDTGSVVVGRSAGDLRALVWTQARGTEYLSEYLMSQGVILPMDVVLNTCDGISADGRTFAGTAITNGDPFSGFGYVVTIPSPPSLVFASFGAALAVRRRTRSN